MKINALESLVFTVGPRETYEGATGCDWETTNAFYEWKGNQLRAHLKAHFSRVDKALEAVTPDLENWKIWTEINRGPGALRVEYVHGTRISGLTGEGVPILERVQDRPDYIYTEVGVIRSVMLLQKAYPEPPPIDFKIEGEVLLDLMERYREFRRGRETLEGVSYYFASKMKREMGRKGGRDWRISKSFIERLGALSSWKGSPRSRRKADAEEFGPGEREWLEQALPVLLKHLGRVEGGARPEELTVDLVVRS